MSFDIFFNSCRFAGKQETRKNPFTGEEVTVDPAVPLSSAEVESIHQVLARAGCDDAPDDGVYAFEFDDGGVAEVFGSDFETGCMVALRWLTPDTAQFLFDLMNAANWVMFWPSDNLLALKSTNTQTESLPEGFPKIVDCHTVDELGSHIAGDVESWQKYRDQVVGDSESS
jgi:hypothetical protein